MGGIPWLFVFALIAWFAMRRGWGWLLVLSVFCMGVVAGGIGDVIASGFQGVLSGGYRAVVGLLNQAA